MSIQREEVTTLFQLAEVYDFESYQERLHHLALHAPVDVVSALGIVKELESSEGNKAETAHGLADDLLLRYINQAEITLAFNRIHR